MVFTFLTINRTGKILKKQLKSQSLKDNGSRVVIDVVKIY